MPRRDNVYAKDGEQNVSFLPSPYLSGTAHAACTTPCYKGVNIHCSEIASGLLYYADTRAPAAPGALIRISVVSPFFLASRETQGTAVAKVYYYYYYYVPIAHPQSTQARAWDSPTLQDQGGRR